jgi:hypothetical protein
VRLVARVVLDQHGTEPPQVALGGRLPRLAFAQLGLRRRHLGEPAEDEVRLDRDGLLAPQGAVVVEDGDPLLNRHGRRRPLDEVDDRLPGGSGPPGG